EAEDPPSVALFEGEGGEQLVGDFSARDERQPDPGGEQDQDVDVAQRTAAQHRVGDQRDADRQPSDAQGRQFGGEDAGEGDDHGRLEDRAPPALARAAAASGKTSVISASLRLGAAREAAPTAVTTTIGVAIATSCHHIRRRASTAIPAMPSRTTRIWMTPPAVELIASPGPLLPIRPTLRAVIAR